MNISTNLSLSQKLSPQMIQSLKLLQISNLQLEQIIKQEMEINPLLEVSETVQETDQAEEAGEKENSEKETTSEKTEEDKEKEEQTEKDEWDSGDLEFREERVDLQESLNEGFDLGYKFSEEQPVERFERIPVEQDSLEKNLKNQLSFIHLNATEKKIAEYIIGNLNSDGYLTHPVENIASEMKIDKEVIEEVLITKIQLLDPPGIGSRHLQECLQIQLKSLKRGHSLEMQIVTESFTELEKRQYQEIARKLGKPLAAVQQAVMRIAKLNPKPGELIGLHKAMTVIPDLIVEKIEGKFAVAINDRYIPRLTINSGYKNFIKTSPTVTKQTKKFIREKINSASWLIKSIEQRRNTMMRVMLAIVDKQIGFFEKGIAELKPLIMQEVADVIGMHVSTVARVTNGKYVQTPHGVFELKFFFDGGVGKALSTSNEMSATSIKDKIFHLVGDENKNSPMSDQEIVEGLKKIGLHVARRTVAKYREQLKILPARFRKSFN